MKQSNRYKINSEASNDGVFQKGTGGSIAYQEYLFSSRGNSFNVVSLFPKKPSLSIPEDKFASHQKSSEQKKILES